MFHGADKSSVATLNGYSLSINNLDGKQQTVYGKMDTNPGHYIYRLPSGKRWEHKGEKNSDMAI